VKTKSLQEQGLLQAIYDYTRTLPEDVPLRGRILLLQSGRTEPPICPQCNKEPVRWVKFTYSWGEFCSPKCTCQAKYGSDTPLQSTAIQKRTQQTVSQRYGVTNPSQIAEVKKKKAETLSKNYGVPNPSQSSVIQERKRKTSQERYGMDCPLAAPEVRRKIQATVQAHYGVSNIAQASSVKDKKQTTTQAHYGVDNPFQAAAVQAKAKDTCLKRYGKPFSGSVTAIREKMQASLLAHYGVRNPAQSAVVREKVKQSTLKTQEASLRRFYGNDTYEKLHDPEFWRQEYLVKKKTLEQIAEELGVNKASCGNYMFQVAPDIPVRISAWVSKQERELMEFLQANYAGSILSQKTLGQISREKGLVSEPNQINLRFSLDLYLPDLNLAIEHNGLYWHSTLEHPDPLYHLSKTEACESLGIRLIHIWEDDWNTHRSLMESKLLHIMGQNWSLPVCHARQCTVKVPTSTDKRVFYEQNHIKGDGQGQVTYGLQDSKGIWRAMVTFKSTATPGVYDLNRFATDITVRVPGAFSKLLKHFQRNHVYSEIYTFADRCWSDGKVYEQTGFIKTGITPPAFHGVENNFCTRISRRAYTHERLSRRFPATYDSSLTQLENMAAAGIPVIWDCGNYKFSLYKVESL
jgi:hypothetical protein